MIKNFNTQGLLFLFSICLLSFTSCKTDNNPKAAKTEITRTALSNTEQMLGSWKMIKVDTFTGSILKDLSEEEAEVFMKSFRKKIKTEGAIYSFFNNGLTSLVNLKKYHGAKWKLKGASVDFIPNIEGMNRSEEKLLFKNVEFYNKADRKYFVAEIEDKGIFHFRQICTPLSNEKEDPFHPSNNQWRVVAEGSETYKQIRQRLYNYTKHCHYLFKSSMDRQVTKVNTGNTASIYKYYDGAIALVDGGKVPDAWMENFYSPDEAMDAYAMAKKYFKGNILRGEAGKGEGKAGYVVANEAVFRKLLGKMEKDL